VGSKPATNIGETIEVSIAIEIVILASAAIGYAKRRHGALASCDGAMVLSP